VKFVVMMAIRGTIALKPKKKQHMSTMGFGHHSKVTMGGTISTARTEISSIKPSLNDLVIGQAKINENLTKKLSYNDKIIENINAKLETLCSSIQS